MALFYGVTKQNGLIDTSGVYNKVLFKTNKPSLLGGESSFFKINNNDFGFLKTVDGSLRKLNYSDMSIASDTFFYNVPVTSSGTSFSALYLNGITNTVSYGGTFLKTYDASGNVSLSEQLYASDGEKPYDLVQLSNGVVDSTGVFYCKRGGGNKLYFSMVGSVDGTYSPLAQSITLEGIESITAVAVGRCEKVGASEWQTQLAISCSVDGVPKIRLMWLGWWLNTNEFNITTFTKSSEYVVWETSTSELATNIDFFIRGNDMHEFIAVYKNNFNILLNKVSTGTEYNVNGFGSGSGLEKVDFNKDFSKAIIQRASDHKTVQYSVSGASVIGTDNVSNSNQLMNGVLVNNEIVGFTYEGTTLGKWFLSDPVIDLVYSVLSNTYIPNSFSTIKNSNVSLTINNDTKYSNRPGGHIKDIEFVLGIRDGGSFTATTYATCSFINGVATVPANTFIKKYFVRYETICNLYLTDGSTMHIGFSDGVEYLRLSGNTASSSSYSSILINTNLTTAQINEFSDIASELRIRSYYKKASEATWILLTEWNLTTTPSVATALTSSCVYQTKVSMVSTKYTEAELQSNIVNVTTLTNYGNDVIDEIATIATKGSNFFTIIPKNIGKTLFFYSVTDASGHTFQGTSSVFGSNSYSSANIIGLYNSTIGNSKCTYSITVNGYTSTTRTIYLNWKAPVLNNTDIAFTYSNRSRYYLNTFYNFLNGSGFPLVLIRFNTSVMGSIKKSTGRITGAKVKIRNMTTSIETEEIYNADSIYEYDTSVSGGIEPGVTIKKFMGENLDFNTTYQISVQLTDDPTLKGKWSSYSTTRTFTTSPEMFSELNMIYSYQSGNTIFSIPEKKDRVEYYLYDSVSNEITLIDDSCNITFPTEEQNKKSFYQIVRIINTSTISTNLIIPLETPPDFSLMFRPEDVDHSKKKLFQYQNIITGSPINKFKLIVHYNICNFETGEVSLIFLNKENKTKYFCGNLNDNLENIVCDIEFDKETIVKVFKGETPVLESYNIIKLNDFSVISPQVICEYIFSSNNFNTYYTSFDFKIILKNPDGVSFYKSTNVVEENKIIPIFENSVKLNYPIDWIIRYESDSMYPKMEISDNTYLDKPIISIIDKTNLYRKVGNQLIKFNIRPCRNDINKLALKYCYFISINGIIRYKGFESFLSQEGKDIEIIQDNKLFNVLKDIEKDVVIKIYSSTQTENELYTNNLVYEKITTDGTYATTEEEINEDSTITLFLSDLVKQYNSVDSKKYFERNPVGLNLIISDDNSFKVDNSKDSIVHWLPITNESMPVFSLNRTVVGTDAIMVGTNRSSLEALDGSIYIPKEDLLNKNHQRFYFQIGDREFDVVTLYDSDNDIGFFPNDILFLKKELLKIDIPKYSFVDFIKYEILNEFGENIGIEQKTHDVTINKYFELDIKISDTDYILDGSYLVKFFVGSKDKVDITKETALYKEVKVVKMLVRLNKLPIGKVTFSSDHKNKDLVIK